MNEFGYIINIFNETINYKIGKVVPSDPYKFNIINDTNRMALIFPISGYFIHNRLNDIKLENKYDNRQREVYGACVTVKKEEKTGENIYNIENCQTSTFKKIVKLDNPISIEQFIERFKYFEKHNINHKLYFIIIELKIQL